MDNGTQFEWLAPLAHDTGHSNIIQLNSLQLNPVSFYSFQSGGMVRTSNVFFVCFLGVCCFDHIIVPEAHDELFYTEVCSSETLPRMPPPRHSPLAFVYQVLSTSILS